MFYDKCTALGQHKYALRVHRAAVNVNKFAGRKIADGWEAANHGDRFRRPNCPIAAGRPFTAHELAASRHNHQNTPLRVGKRLPRAPGSIKSEGDISHLTVEFCDNVGAPLCENNLPYAGMLQA